MYLDSWLHCFKSLPEGLFLYHETIDQCSDGIGHAKALSREDHAKVPFLQPIQTEEKLSIKWTFKGSIECLSKWRTKFRSIHLSLKHSLEFIKIEKKITF